MKLQPHGAAQARRRTVDGPPLCRPPHSASGHTSAASHPSSPAPATQTWRRTVACPRTCAGPLRSPRPPTASAPPSSPGHAGILDGGPCQRSLEPPTSSPPSCHTCATCSSPQRLSGLLPTLFASPEPRPPPAKARTTSSIIRGRVGHRPLAGAACGG
jgi:hypothetical protein